MDRCRAWESHSDFPGRSASRPEPPYPAYVVKTPEKEPDPVRAVTVNKPEYPVEDTNELLRKLVEMLTPKATPTTRVPELAGLDKFIPTLDRKGGYQETDFADANRTDKVRNKAAGFS